MKKIYMTGLFLISGLVNGATITVDTNTIAAGDGQCDLADAITSANTDTSIDTCETGSGNDNIVLGLNTSISTPLPSISSNISMARPASLPIIQGAVGYNNRILTISPLGTLSLSGVTVMRGNMAGNGGCIMNNGTLTTSNNTTIQFCNATGNGGGLYVGNGATTTINATTFSNNTSTVNGGAIYAGARVEVSTSKFSGNNAVQGGGFYADSVSGTSIFNKSSFTTNSSGINCINTNCSVYNTTIGANNGDGLTYQAAGGINSLRVQNSTIKNNSGFGLRVLGVGVPLVDNTAFDNNTLNNCSLVTTLSGTNNVGDDNSCSVNVAFSNTINLSGLNTGNTNYYTPQNGSSLIDAGSNPVCDNANIGNRDQIFSPRPETGGTVCDVGAIENPNGIVFNSSISVTKTATLTTDNGGIGIADAGDVITFNVSVQNTGDSNLNSLVVNDPMGGGALSCVPTSLIPAQVSTCTAYTYNVTQSDVNNGGSIDNTATATAFDPANTQVTDDDSTSTLLPEGNANMTLTKTANITTDNGTPGQADAGDVITFNVSVLNTGNQTLHALVVNDAMGGGALSCSPTTFNPNQTATCTAYTYNVTQSDVNTGGTIDNTAFGTALSPIDNPVNAQDSTSTPIVAGMPLLTVVKVMSNHNDVDNNGFISLNDILTYTITATNTGNVALTNVVVTDAMITPNSNTCPTLAVGADCVLVGTYTIQQSDVNNGQVENTGAADSDQTPPITDDVITVIPTSSAITVTKTATITTDNGTAGQADADDVITFNVSVQNTGNTTLNSLVVNDPMGGGALSCVPTTLTPNLTATCTAYTYTVLQGDVDNGGVIQNTADGTALDPSNTPVNDDDSTNTPIVAGAPAITVTKTAVITTDNGAPGLADVNDVITFNVSVLNSGNQSLTNLEVDDPMAGGSLSCSPLALTPGQTATCTAYTYTVLQGDVDAGGTIDNTATGTARSPNKTNVTDDDSTSTTLVGQNGSLSVTKTATLSTDNGTIGVADLGDVITYGVSVQNNGNVTLTNLVVDDPMGGGALSCSPTTLAPGQSATCISYTYTVLQADINNGGTIDNTATATAIDPNNNPVVDDDTTNNPVAVNGSAMTVTKTATITTDNGSVGVADAGDVITFGVSVINNGNVTLTNLVVDDVMGGGALSCSPTTLMPGQSSTCTAYTYNVTQSDVDAGGTIDNTAAATALDPSNNPVTDDDTTTTPIVAGTPAITVTKTATLTTDNGLIDFADADDVITFDISVLNSGNQTLTSLVVDDPMGGGSLSCTPTTLAPGQSAVCTSYTYTVLQGDVNNGGTIDNTATATALDPSNNPVIDDDTTSTLLAGSQPSLSIDKSFTSNADEDQSGTVTLNDTLTFTIIATNDGNVTLNNVYVNDPMITPDFELCLTLEVGDSCVLVGTYVVQQSDIDNGEVVNAGESGSDEVDPPVTDTVIVTINPQLQAETIKVPVNNPFALVIMLLAMMFFMRKKLFQA